MPSARAKVNTHLYGRRSGERLAREDWVAAGLAVLARVGANELKAEPLAKALKVSRGSFYWHFEDVGAFHRAVLEAWEERATTRIIALVEADAAEARARLKRLTRLVFSADGGLERQVRAWAARDPAAAAAQERVDRRRLAYVKGLFEGAGCPAEAAHLRARLLYLALIGQFAAGKGLAMPAAEVEAVVGVLLSEDLMR
jgi:AcrR family transcriptional regulator